MTRAFVFDLDGTLTDNMHLHAESFAIFCERHGLPPYSEELRLRLDGKRNRDIFPIVFDQELSMEEIRRYSREKEGIYRELSTGTIQVIPGALELLAQIESGGHPFAIATSAPAENVTHSLREIGLEGRFPIVARSDQVPRGKPYPDVFIKAAELIEVAPAQCHAFEDAPAGIRAARAAGMPTFALTTTFDRARLAEEAPEAELISDYVDYLERWPIGSSD